MPNLVISSWNSPRGVDNGILFDVQVTVQNGGNTAAAAFLVRGWFSLDEVPANAGAKADALLFEWQVPGLEGGAAVSDTFSVRFTTFPIHRTYFVVGEVDAGHQIAESNEADNIRWTSANVSR